jgi:hypothetical protein
MAEPFLGNRWKGVGRDFCASRLEKQLLARALDLVLAAAPNSRKLGKPPWCETVAWSCDQRDDD